MKLLNIIVPMAGAGSRFVQAGYSTPKPLIPVNGIPMIKLVINNLTPSQPHRFIFICQRKHIDEYPLAQLLSNCAPGCTIVTIDGLTDGAVCTVLAARRYIESTDNPLMIANCDQFVDAPIDEYLSCLDKSNHDGLIMTMSDTDPKWSFVGLDQEGKVIKVVEKQAISAEATVGIYNFKRGSDFLLSADHMIKNNFRVNGEFYVAPVFNHLINLGKHIGIYNIGRVGEVMYGLGTPTDLEYFLNRSTILRSGSVFLNRYTPIDK